MAINQIATKTASRFAGKALGTYLKFSLYFIFLAFLILNAVMIGIEQKSIVPVVEDLGYRVFAPTHEILEMSKEIQANGILPIENTPFMNIIFMFKNYVLLFFNFAVIWGWLRFIYWIIHRFDSSQQVLWAMMSLMVLLTINWIYIAFMVPGGPEKMMIPINAFVEFAKTLPILLDPFTQIAVEQAPKASDMVNITNGTM